ncbi:MAG: YdcF family protein [Phycisphaeraceae bacterium]|nr:YdcF family protein [Phycisphaeraceae bacterium]
MIRPVARAFGLTIGLVLLASLPASLFGWDPSLWILDLRPLGPLKYFLFVAGGGTLVAIGIERVPPRWGFLVPLVIGAVGLISLIDTARFFALAFRGNFASFGPIPLSAIVFAVIVMIGASQRSRPWAGSARWVAPLALACFALFPATLMWTFGLTDYRRPADAAVVFGAKVYADGRVSDVVADRVRTACHLYKQRLVHAIVFSGGPGEGATSEPQAMRALAITEGVPSSACVLDESGLNTRASLKNVQALAAERGWTSLLAVSDFYHLPRIKMLSDREGLEMITVPARQGQPRSGTPFWICRETAAWWAYAFGIPTG